MTKGGATTAEARRSRALWLAFFGPAVAWIVAQQVDFYLSSWVCATGRRWVVLLVTGMTLAAAAGGALAAWGIWRRDDAQARGRSPEASRRRFMAAGAVLLAVFFTLAILAFAIPQIVHRPCD